MMALPPLPSARFRPGIEFGAQLLFRCHRLDFRKEHAIFQNIKEKKNNQPWPASPVKIRGSSSKLLGMSEHQRETKAALYCPTCAREVTDPLTCGDCSAVICRICGTPLESSDELGMG